MSSDTDINEELRNGCDASDRAPSAAPNFAEFGDEEAALGASDHIPTAAAATPVRNDVGTTGQSRFTASAAENVINIDETEPEAYYMEEEGALGRVSSDRSSSAGNVITFEEEAEVYYMEEEGDVNEFTHDASSPAEDVINIDEMESEAYYMEEEDALYHVPGNITGQAHHSVQKATGKTFVASVPTVTPTVTPILKPTGKPLGKPPKKRIVKPAGNPRPKQAQGLSVSLHNRKLDILYPHDSYSVIADNGPDKNGAWPKQKKIFFFCGCVPYCFQLIFLWLLISSLVWNRRGTFGEVDNPLSNQGFFTTFIPSGTQRIVRITQFFSLVYYVVFPDASQKDIVTAVRSFPRPSKVQSGDRVASMRISCMLRAAEGISAVLATLVLIISSNTVVDIILNFTAISFISNLDDYAFRLAASGEFGKSLQAETERVANKKLPRCMHRTRIPKHVYNNWVKFVIGALLFCFMSWVIIFQNRVWVTKQLRVRFQDPQFEQYSGCYSYVPDKKSKEFSRNEYVFDEDDQYKFSYCRDERYWVLWDTNSVIDKRKGIALACDAPVIVKSEQTDVFDISSSFFDNWVTASNTPVELYFFPKGKEEELFCDLELGDGTCDDPALNKEDFEYDEGDCCAATCIGSKCGYSGIPNVFNSNISADGFDNCVDPEMEATTIKLNSVVSSRNPEFTSNIFPVDVNVFEVFRLDESTWRNETPAQPYFSLDCDGKNVLTVYIDETMSNSSQTVKVANGADCSLVVVNTTTNSDRQWDDPPIWYIDYTLYHGEKGYVEDENVEILTRRTNEVSEANFKRIPECYFKELKDFVGIETIYTASEASNRAIDWLIDDKTGNSECGEESFVERYALVNMFYAIDAPGEFIDSARHCAWSSIGCSGGKVNTITLKDAKLEKNIPSEIGMLRSVTELDLSDNNFTSIPVDITRVSSLLKISMNNNLISLLPTELGDLTSLQLLSVYANNITEIPKEIGMMTNLQELILSQNSISLVPEELGSLKDLRTLLLDGNLQISMLPKEIGNLITLQELSLPQGSLTTFLSEIGKLENLRKLVFYQNMIASLPTEIGGLTSLIELDLWENVISSLPTEVGKLQGLEILDLGYNNVASLPSEIARLTSLHSLGLDSNEIVDILPIGEMRSLQQLNLKSNKISFLPTELGRLSNLQSFDMAGNQISSIPTELGGLSNLQSFEMAVNQISSIPTEIAVMSGLKELGMWTNQISSVPTEVMNLTGLEGLYLFKNQITSLPSEIGLLTKLTDLRFNHNQITSLPTEIGLLTNLKSLRLHHNFISVIPSEIALLTNLETLALSDNQITSLPTEMGLLLNVNKLFLGGNNITEMNAPPELLDLCYFNFPFTTCFW